MVHNFSWVIPGKLAGAALPGGGYAGHQDYLLSDLQDLYSRGVRCLVSLTDTAAGFASACRQADLIWHYFPIPNFEVPQDLEAFHFLAQSLLAHIQGGRPVCAHCYAGVGRTGLLLSCLAGLYHGLPAAQAIETVRRQRPALETLEQEQFVQRYLERYLRG